MALPDPLPHRARADAEAELTRLGAVAEDGRATGLGRLLVSLPVEPRWGRALLDGADLVGARTAAEVIAAVSDGVRVPAADVPALVRGLRSSRGDESARWRREAQRLERMAAHPALAGDGAAEGAEENTDAPPRGPESDVPDDVREGVVVALARPEWIARRMDAHGDQWLLASGTRAGLETGSPLRHHEWLAVAELTRAAGRVAPFVYTGIQMVSKRLLDGAPEGPFSTNILWDRAIEDGRCFGVVHQGLWFDVGTPAAIPATEEALARG